MAWVGERFLQSEVLPSTFFVHDFLKCQTVILGKILTGSRPPPPQKKKISFHDLIMYEKRAKRNARMADIFTLPVPVYKK